MPQILRVPNGTTKYGKPKYKKVIACVWDECAFTGSVDEVRQHEREHKNV